MQWTRLAQAVLLGTGLSIGGAGCAAVNALVSSPAGITAANTPDRLVAIGRVYENQGNMRRATAMYRQALKSDPGNSIARDRMQFIAQMGSGQNATPQDQLTRQAIAMADSVTTPAKRAFAAETTTAKNTSTPAKLKAPTSLDEALANDALLASLQPTEPGLPSMVAPAELVPPEQEPAKTEAEPEAVTVLVEEPAEAPEEAPAATEVAAEAIETVDAEPGFVEIVNVEWDLAGATDVDFGKETAASVSIESQAEEEATAGVETVSYDSDEEEGSSVTTLATSSGWRPSTRRDVTLEQVLRYMEDVDAHHDELIAAVRRGENDGVQALAASIVGEFPVEDQDANIALSDACFDPSEMLQVAARVALTERGLMTTESVTHLLKLLSSLDADVRTQSAICLRHFDGTEWSEQCVTGLSRLLEDGGRDTVILAATVLGDFGIDAADETDRLTRLTLSSDEVLSEAASLAIRRIEMAASQSKEQ